MRINESTNEIASGSRANGKMNGFQRCASSQMTKRKHTLGVGGGGSHPVFICRRRLIPYQLNTQWERLYFVTATVPVCDTVDFSISSKGFSGVAFGPEVKTLLSIVHTLVWATGVKSQLHWIPASWRHTPLKAAGLGSTSLICAMHLEGPHWGSGSWLQPGLAPPAYRYHLPLSPCLLNQ